MVDAVLDLLAGRFHPPVGPVNVQRMTRGQECPPVVVRK
jgi:hypothetical protein